MTCSYVRACACSILSLLSVKFDSHVWHDSFICAPLPILKCAMTHSHMCHDSSIWFTRVTWLIHMCPITYSSVCHDPFTCVSWLFHLCKRAGALESQLAACCSASQCVAVCCNVMSRHLSSSKFICAWHFFVLCNVRGLALPHVRRYEFTCMTWLTHMCDMTPSHVCHASSIGAMPCSHVWHDSFVCVTWLIHMCQMTHSDMRRLFDVNVTHL